MSTSERKRADRERKRLVREAPRMAGVPLPGVVDRAIVEGLRRVIAERTWDLQVNASGQIVVNSDIKVRRVIRLARFELLEKGYSAAASNAAIAARLSMPSDNIGRLSEAPQAAPPEQSVEDEAWNAVQEDCALAKGSEPAHQSCTGSAGRGAISMSAPVQTVSIHASAEQSVEPPGPSMSPCRTSWAYSCVSGGGR